MRHSRLQDPLPTFERLGQETGVPVDDLVHHALVRWVSAGSEALMALEPAVLRDLAEAREREDWARPDTPASSNWLSASGT